MGTPARKVQLMITYPHLRKFFEKARAYEKMGRPSLQCIHRAKTLNDVY